MKNLLILFSFALAAFGQYINGSRTFEGPINHCSSVGGTANAITCSMPIAGYVTGNRYQFIATAANTSAATINIQSLGTKTIKKPAGGVTTDLVANDIRSGQVVVLAYDGTNMQMVSQLGNAGGGSGESNTASNSGSAGTGVFYQKSGVDLQFYKLDSANSMLTIALSGSDKINFTIVPSAFDLANIGGSLGASQIASGSKQGNGSKVQMAAGTPVTGYCVQYDANGNTTPHTGPCGSGSSSITQTIFLPAAHTDLGAASTGFRRPASNYPEALSVIGSNTIGAVLAFDPAVDESAQVPLLFPAGVTAVNIRFTWRAIATSGNVVWAAQTVCVGPGETGDPSFNAAQTVTDAAQATTLQDNDATISSVTTTGCAAGERFIIKIFRDADNGSDSMNGDAWLVSLAVEITRTL